MAASDSVRRFLGLAGSLDAGFTRSDYGSRMPFCDACGALVAIEGQATHSDWHAAAGAEQPIT